MPALESLQKPSEMPISLGEAKAHLRVSHNAEDDLIARRIRAAVAAVERYCHRSLTVQSWAWSWEESDDWIELPMAPIISLSRVVAVCESGEYDIDPSIYFLDRVHAKLRLRSTQSWPYFSDQVSFRAEYHAGFTDVPADLLQACYLTLGDLYENRSTVIVGTVAAQLPVNAQQICDDGGWVIHTL
jgi:uncharacterized phiE125 gp8 family phage protein